MPSNVKERNVMSKYLYLCVSWCMRTSYQQLMIRKYLNSMHAFHQPPLALQVLLEHLTIRQRGELETINGAIPEPFIRTSEALLALLGQHDTEPAWRRPLLKSARAAHAWKWMRRMMFGNYSTFLSLFSISVIRRSFDKLIKMQPTSHSMKRLKAPMSTKSHCA